MEKVAGKIERYCSFPMIEKIKLFKLTPINFLTGNEDGHLKKYSLISIDDLISLVPASDLFNTSIVINNAQKKLRCCSEAEDINSREEMK
ncbi:MAG: hypothetical protein HY965_08945 [Ignavibacteriales bacterium]|nr:hypothetical protein [Ignavibacteriales bacterium]